MAAGSTGILKYFRPVRPSSSLTTPTLPDPDGLLNERILAKAIELANVEVKQSKESSRGRRLTYMILTPSQHYEVGRRASEHGATACLTYFSKKYRYTTGTLYCDGQVYCMFTRKFTSDHGVMCTCTVLVMLGGGAVLCTIKVI